MPPSRDEQGSLVGRALHAWRNRNNDHAARTGRRGPDDSWVDSTKGDDAAVTDATNTDDVTGPVSDDEKHVGGADVDQAGADTDGAEANSAEANSAEANGAADTMSTDDEPTGTVAADGDQAEGDTAEGDTANADTAEGDAADADTADDDSRTTSESDADGPHDTDIAELHDESPSDPDTSGIETGTDNTDDTNADLAPAEDSDVTDAAADATDAHTADADTAEADDSPAEAVESPEPAEAVRPKPKGGLGIDSSTKVIRRQDLPDTADLADLDSIDALSGDDSGEATDEEPDESVSTHPKPGGSANPTDSATTVIRRDDLPDADELDDLSEINALGAGVAGAAATAAPDEADTTDTTDTTDSTDEWVDVDEPASADDTKSATENDTVTGGDETEDDSESGSTKVLPATAGAAATTAAATTASQGWSTTAHKPEVIRGKDETSQSKAKSSGRRRLPWIIGAAVIVLIAVVVGGVFAYLNLRPPAPADEAADAAEKFSTALYEGDLETLRSVTCGERNQFYQSISDSDFQKIYDGQKSRDELIRVDDVKAVKVTGDGSQAVVEVSAVHSTNPNDPMTVTINLQKSGDQWKVCTPQ